ncbi:hypothetical protein GQX73_g1618 [Xylaria multiplex]|uniref:NADH dehydrogenase [ubiquinone] 1 alpha subcomplex subunit 13 n=1 Tax=Xylaria multiplex TaxID=323545 RepID=A0A7C8MZ03_9PEZI|nr:hypothetical protein GQX73_g1618 [Xylaria multiplex]
MPQDMPPVGGYAPVQYKRNLPASGFRPGTWLVAMGVVMTYGFYKLGQGIKEQNELAREKMWSRIHLIPLLQAEEDRDLVRRHLADQAREKELLVASRMASKVEPVLETALETDGSIKTTIV